MSQHGAPGTPPSIAGTNTSLTSSALHVLAFIAMCLPNLQHVPFQLSCDQDIVYVAQCLRDAL